MTAREGLAGRRRDPAPWIALCDAGARAAVIYCLPILTVPASKAALPVFVAAALLCVAGLLLRGESPRAILRLASPPPSADRWFTLAFILLAAVSILWSMERPDTAWGFAETMLVLLATLAAANLLPTYRREELLWHLCLALILCSALVLVELAFNMPLRRLVGSRLQTSQLNRAIEIMVMYATPVMAALGRRTPFAWAAMAVLAVATWFSDSGAGVLALILAAITLLVARFRVEAARRLGLVAALLCLVSAPFIGSPRDILKPARKVAPLAQAHVGERVDIWRSYGEVAKRLAATGTGFATAATVAATEYATGAPRDLSRADATHPHHVFLQIWVELGVAGVLLAGCMIWTMFRRIAAQPPERQAQSLALLAAMGTVALTGHGAWEGWWLSSIGAALALRMLLWRSA